MINKPQFDLIKSYGLHSPYSTHLIIADLLAGFSERIISNCTSSSTSNSGSNSGSGSGGGSGGGSEGNYDIVKATLPPSLTNVKHFEHTLCDENKPYLMNHEAVNKFHPDNLTDYESKLTGWTDFADYHSTPGWIINNNVKANIGDDTKYMKARLLVFPLPEKEITALSSSDTVILKVKYLRTYSNGGYAGVYLCNDGSFNPGTRIEKLDALFLLNTWKLSIPQLYTHSFSSSDLQKCLSMPAENRNIVIRYMGADDVDHSAGRLDLKFKLFSVSMCHVDTSQ